LVTEANWNKAFEYMVPTVSLGVATLSVILGVMALTRSSPLGSRIYYQDGQCLVSVRHGRWHELREFVQPDNPDVVAIYQQYGPDYWSLYDFVCRHVTYKSEVREMWQFPSETIARELGDCEDTAFLLTSLMRAGGAPNCHVALGSYQGYGHAWSVIGGQILETTYTSARPVPDPQDYCPYACFNDQEVVELWPGALGEVFQIGRDEVAKLNLMAKVIGNEVPPECPSLWPPLVYGLVTGGILGVGFAMILQKGEEAR